jgi:phenylacetic acid degradation operon negative regulatory protein
MSTPLADDERVGSRTISLSGVAAPNNRPRSLILDIYGGFVRRIGGWISIADLILLMRDVGVDEPAVRSAVSLMKRRNLLAYSRRNGVAGYRLTPTASDILEEGDVRIFRGSAPADLSEGWTLVVFSVPESRRDQRHVLRSQLTWLGLGRVAPGVWIGPRCRLTDVRALLERLNLEQYVNLFQAQYEGFDSVRQLIAHAWDLPRMRAMYRRFIRRNSPLLARWQRDPKPHNREAFISYCLVVDEWRRFPYLDPGLPLSALPEEWEGEAAHSLFTELIGFLDAPALAHVVSVVRAERRTTTMEIRQPQHEAVSVAAHA